MTARNHQTNAGIDLAIGIGELTSVEMTLQMIDGHERDVERKRERLGRRQPDDERPDQSRPGRDGHGLDVA